MTRGTVNHGLIASNLESALRSRLRGGACRPLREAGLATVGDSVRYPDILVTRSKVAGEARTVPGAVVVFEVLSATSGRVDRIEKVREYKAVASIRCYLVVEYASPGVTVLRREAPDQDWTATALMGEETLSLPEIGIELPVAELYEGIELPNEPKESAPA